MIRILKNFPRTCNESNRTLDDFDFGELITDPEQPKSAPKVLFNQIDFDIDDFLEKLNPILFTNLLFQTYMLTNSESKSWKLLPRKD